jgi:hypothetical protein
MNAAKKKLTEISWTIHKLYPKLDRDDLIAAASASGWINCLLSQGIVPSQVELEEIFEEYERLKKAAS